MSDRVGRRGVRLEGFECHPLLCMDFFQKDSPTLPLPAAAAWTPSTVPAVELKLEFEGAKSKVPSPKKPLGDEGESWLMDGTCRVRRMSR